MLSLWCNYIVGLLKHFLFWKDESRCFHYLSPLDSFQQNPFLLPEKHEWWAKYVCREKRLNYHWITKTQSLQWKMVPQETTFQYLKHLQNFQLVCFILKSHHWALAEDVKKFSLTPKQGVGRRGNASDPAVKCQKWPQNWLLLVLLSQLTPELAQTRLTPYQDTTPLRI